MKDVRAAVVSEEGGDWSIATVELADPVEDELLVRVVATRAQAWSRRSDRS